MTNQSRIRNFAIIAHIDHGKSTLADRLLEITGTVEMRDMQAQLLDSNPIERERGITIKLAPVRMHYKFLNSKSEYLNKSQIPNHKDLNSLEIRNLNLEIASSEYILNLIDTPGHVDFSYEVSRSLAACEGALLVVDATQGVQAQTLANLALARKNNLVIIPLINKIDMPHARIAETKAELSALGFSEKDMIEISAKTGEHIDRVLEAIVLRIPAPTGFSDKPLRALVFSSRYDPHKGVVVFVRVVDGLIQYPCQIRFLVSGAEVVPIELGVFIPAMNSRPGLEAGEVGYIATGLKDVRLAKVGDTITTANGSWSLVHGKNSNNTFHSAVSHEPPTIKPLPGYKEPKPMVFLSLFPLNSDEFTQARESLEKLRLSDSAFTFRPISSQALGNGFHCGFLGLLHAEIVQERLSREFDLNMIATAPSVEYHLQLAPGVSLSKLGMTASSIIATGERAETASDTGLPAGEAGNQHIKVPQSSMDHQPSTNNLTVSIQSASEFPDPTYIDGVKEPIMEVKIFTPKRYVGAIMQLAVEKRGEYIDLKYLADQAEFTYLIPLADMIIDFFDRLKSISEGYASLDYEFFDFQAVDVVKIDILVNKEKVDALSFLAVRSQAHYRSIAIVERLAEVIPRQQFEIPIQGAIGGQIVARSDVKAFRKDVIQKLYGGDRTRKDKLLKKQAKGKAKMKLIGRVEIPQTAFFEVLKRE